MNRPLLPTRLTHPIRCDDGDTLTRPGHLTTGRAVTPSLVLAPRRRGPVPDPPTNRRQALPNQGASARPRPTKASRLPAAINKKAAVKNGDGPMRPSPFQVLNAIKTGGASFVLPAERESRPRNETETIPLWKGVSAAGGRGMLRLPLQRRPPTADRTTSNAPIPTRR